MVQAESNHWPLVNDPGSLPCSRYCYTTLNLFEAASAGWDPITSHNDFKHLLSGTHIDQKMARHVTIAREDILKNTGDKTYDSFEFLQNMFEMDMRVRPRASTKRLPSKGRTSMIAQLELSTRELNQSPQYSDSEYASTDHVENDDSETGLPPPLPPPRFVPVDEPTKGWKPLSHYSAVTNKRRASSPPQEYDNERRPSTDGFPQFVSSADDVSDQADSISSINSYSSINAAYGTLALGSPASGQSSKLISSSPHSTTPGKMQQLDMPRATSSYDMLRKRAAELGIMGTRIDGFFKCDCCPKQPRKFDTLEEVR